MQAQHNVTDKIWALKRGVAAAKQNITWQKAVQRMKIAVRSVHVGGPRQPYKKKMKWRGMNATPRHFIFCMVDMLVVLAISSFSCMVDGLGALIEVDKDILVQRGVLHSFLAHLFSGMVD